MAIINTGGSSSSSGSVSIKKTLSILYDEPVYANTNLTLTAFVDTPLALQNVDWVVKGDGKTIDVFINHGNKLNYDIPENYITLSINVTAYTLSEAGVTTYYSGNTIFSPMQKSFFTKEDKSNSLEEILDDIYLYNTNNTIRAPFSLKGFIHGSPLKDNDNFFTYTKKIDTWNITHDLDISTYGYTYVDKEHSKIPFVVPGSKPQFNLLTLGATANTGVTVARDSSISSDANYIAVLLTRGNADSATYRNKLKITVFKYEDNVIKMNSYYPEFNDGSNGDKYDGNHSWGDDDPKMYNTMPYYLIYALVGGGGGGSAGTNYITYGGGSGGTSIGMIDISKLTYSTNILTDKTTYNGYLFTLGICGESDESGSESTVRYLGFAEGQVYKTGFLWSDDAATLYNTVISWTTGNDKLNIVCGGGKSRGDSVGTVAAGGTVEVKAADHNYVIYAPKATYEEISNKYDINESTRDSTIARKWTFTNENYSNISDICSLGIKGCSGGYSSDYNKASFRGNDALYINNLNCTTDKTDWVNNEQNCKSMTFESRRVYYGGYDAYFYGCGGPSIFADGGNSGTSLKKTATKGSLGSGGGGSSYWGDSGAGGDGCLALYY